MTTATRTYKVGDKVTPDPSGYGIPRETIGRVFTVAKINPKNLRCDADDGGRGINFPPDLLLPATEENLAARPLGRPFQERVFFNAGDIVTLKSPSHGISTEEPMVVIKHDGGQRANIVRLGGADGQRYWRWPVAALVKRDLGWLAERLVEMA